MGWAALAGCRGGVGAPWMSAAIADGRVSRKPLSARAAVVVSSMTTRSRLEPITLSVPPDLPGPLISPDPPDRTHPRDPIRLPLRTFPRNRRGLRNTRDLRNTRSRRILAGSPGPGHPQEATAPLRPGAPPLPLDLLIAPGAPGPGSSAWRSSPPSSRRWWSSSLRPAALCSICCITRRMPKRRGTRFSRPGRHRPRKMPPRPARMPPLRRRVRRTRHRIPLVRSA